MIGRDPAASAGAELEHVVRVVDESTSMSRTHLEFGVDDAGLWIRDCATTNGSQVEVDGYRNPIQPGQRVPVPAGSTVHMGARRLWVRSTAARVDIGRATIDWGAATHVGAARDRNQDSYRADSPVFVVADGMGGHAAGDIASREVIESLQPLSGRAHVSREMLMDCLAHARTRIGRIPVDDGSRPGTTLSGVIVTQTEDAPCWMVVNIGDSRTYRLDSGGLRQISVDHSVAQTMIDTGALPASGARGSVPFGNVLTRAVMADTDHAPDMWQLPMSPGDRILVCSDGVTGTVDDATIARILGDVRDPLAAAGELVNIALEAGGRDDATALVIDAVAIRSA